MLRPLGKKVLVAENKREETTASGIILDSKGLGESKSGTVVAIGPEVTEVQVGNKILLDWSKSAVTTVDGAQRVIILEENIVAILDEE
jgi:co-chaperonin GroES (HSP10)